MNDYQEVGRQHCLLRHSLNSPESSSRNPFKPDLVRKANSVARSRSSPNRTRILSITTTRRGEKERFWVFNIPLLKEMERLKPRLSRSCLASRKGSISFL
jgi:hypothetical protein